MSFTEIFIRRPVLAAVISLIILLVGLKAYFNLPVRLFPKIDTSAITISVTYPGADAKLMESFVTTQIENALSGINGIDYITSISQTGESDIAVYFNLGYDINTAASDINSKITSIRSQLPKGINDPVVTKLDPDAKPTMYITFYNKQLPPEEIADYLLRVVQPQIQTLPGVAQAAILGRTYAMRIWLNPQLMAAHDVTATDLSNVLQSSNLQSPAGTLTSASQSISVKTNAELQTSDEFNNLVVKDGENSLTRLKDIGRAQLSAKDFNIQAYVNGKEAVVLGVTPSPIANPLTVADEINKILPQITQALPKGTVYNVAWDSSRFIKSSISEVKKAIVLATICVISIMFLFLFSWRALLIPVVTIPLSLIGVCALMLVMGYSINTITLLSMVLAVGMVVDDAIVVSENIHRHLVAGKAPLEASIIGAKEIQFAVIAMTLTLAAVYAPIGFLSGLIGALFKEFAFTLAGAVIISGFIALTLSPMMCSKLFTKNILNNKGAFFIDGLFQKIMTHYKNLLYITLKHRKFVISSLAIILIVSFGIFKIIPHELAPQEDTGMIYIMSTGPTSSNIAYTEKYSKQIDKILQTIPEGDNYLTISYPNKAFSALVLKNWTKRKKSAQDIVNELFPKLWEISGLMSGPVVASMLPGSDDPTPVKFVVQTLGDYNQLNTVMQKLKAAASDNPYFANVDINPKLDQTQIDLNIDRNKAADLGVPINEIGNTVNIALGEPQKTQFSIEGHSYDVIPQLEEKFRNRPDALNMLYVRSKKNNLIPLSNLITTKEEVQPRALTSGYTIGEALGYLQKASKKIIPSNMQTSYAGMSRRFIQTSKTMGMTFAFSLAFIFLILAAQFESFIDPLIVLFSVPLSIFGALLALWLTKGTMNIYSEIGLVTLIGLISKHGILMVGFANQLQKQGVDIREAIIEAATIRLRPILMTTGAMVLGAVPLAFAHGAGAVSRQQIGWVIVGGMSIGTVFTLFVVPAMYVFLATKKKDRT